MQTQKFNIITVNLFPGLANYKKLAAYSEPGVAFDQLLGFGECVCVAPRFFIIIMGVIKLKFE